MRWLGRVEWVRPELISMHAGARESVLAGAIFSSRWVRPHTGVGLERCHSCPAFALILPLILGKSCIPCFLGSKTRKLEQTSFKVSPGLFQLWNSMIYQFTDLPVVKLFLVSTCLCGLSSRLHTYIHIFKIVTLCLCWAISPSTENKLKLVTRVALTSRADISPLQLFTLNLFLPLYQPHF